MLKDELKKLSEEIFFDNTHGGITPKQQKRFYYELIDKVATTDEVKDIDLRGVQSDVIPLVDLSQNLGSAQKAWKTLYTGGLYSTEKEIKLAGSLIPTDEQKTLGNEENKFGAVYTSHINGITLTKEGNASQFLCADGNYKEIWSGWSEAGENQLPAENQINWCVIGEIMVLTGFFELNSIQTEYLTLDIPA